MTKIMFASALTVLTFASTSYADPCANILNSMNSVLSSYQAMIDVCARTAGTNPSQYAQAQEAARKLEDAYFANSQVCLQACMQPARSSCESYPTISGACP